MVWFQLPDFLRDREKLAPDIEERLDSHPLGARMRKLLERPQLGKEVYNRPLQWNNGWKSELGLEEMFNEYELSNCHGTTCWVLGMYDNPRPGFMYGHEMSRFLREYCIELPPKETRSVTIVGCRRMALTHTGIYLAAEDDTAYLFHQPDTGKPFTLEPVQKGLKEFGGDSVTLHTLKGK